MRNVNFTPSKSHAVWNGPINRTCAFARPSPLYGGGSSAGSSLTFENCQITRDRDIEVAAVILENNTTMAAITFNGFALQDAGRFSSIPELLVIGSGSIGQL